MGKRNKILAGLLALALFGPMGPSPVQAAGVTGTGFAEETLTVSSSAVGVTATLCLERGRQTPILAEVLTNAIYFTLDSPSATPDSSDYAAPVGTVISVEKANYLRMIRQSADSSVKITCFRAGQLPTVTSYDKSGTGVTGSGSTTLGPLEVVNTSHQSLATNAADANGTVAAIDGMAFGSIFIITASTHDTAQDLVVEVSPDDATTWNITPIFDVGAQSMRAGTVTLGTGATTTTLLVDLHGMSDLRVRFNGDQTGNATAANIVVTSNVSAIGEMPFALFTQYVDDVYLHLTSVTTVQGIGMVAVPTDGSVDANNVGMPAMSLDRRVHTDANLQVAGTDAAANSGANSAQTQRVTVATDDEINDDLDAIRVAAELSDNIVHLEDVQHATGDAGVPVWGVENADQAALTAGDKDYTGVAVDNRGLVLGSIVHSGQVNDALMPTQAEDVGVSGADVVMMAGVMRDDALASGGAVNADLDAMPMRADLFGAVWMTETDNVGLPLAKVDDTTVHSNAHGVVAIGAVATPTDGSVDANDYGNLAMSLDRRLLADADVVQEATADFTIQMEDTDVAVGAPLFVRLSDGTSAVDAAIDDTTTHSTGTTTLNAIGGVAVPTDTAVAANDLGMFAMSLDRRQFTDANLQIAGTDVDANAGSVSAQTQRIVIADDDPVNDAAVELSAAINSSRVDVTQQAGLLHSNSPTTEVATVSLFAAGDIADTNLGASAAITVTGSGKLSQVCLVFTVGTVTQITTLTVHFFDADPAISENTTDMTVAEALTVVAKADISNFSETAVAQVGCVSDVGYFHSITHVVLENTHGAALGDEAVSVHVWYRRDA